MSKLSPKVIIMLASIFVGMLISNIINSNADIYVPPTRESIDKTKQEIKVLKEETKELEEIINLKSETLKNIKKAENKSEEEVSELLIKDLNYRKTNSGYSKLEGPGISIKMYDNISSDVIGQDVNDDVIHDVDILNILNDLKVAGAEAISINDERVLSMSEIKCGGPIIKINGTSVGTPFVIKAIGDPKILMASVNAPGTYGDTLKNIYYIGFEPNLEDHVVIPAYDGRFDFKYAKPKGEGGM